MKTIGELEERIRDFINSGRRQYNLLKNYVTWNKLCSSLDLIGDTQIAIDAYPKLFNLKEKGISYLIVYGILQTLLLQQDAVKHIGDALDVKVKLPKPLETIRVIRNSAAGHPGHQKENGLSKSSFIIRMSISPTGFELMNVYSGGKEYQIIDQVSIPSLIEIQQKYLAEILSKVITELERQEMKHRGIHRDKKLIDIFPDTINYHFSVILTSTGSRNKFSYATINLEVIAGSIESFKNELTDRGEWGVHDAIDYYYELIDYPLKRLEAYFNGDDAINKKDAYIYASFLWKQLESLQEIARDLDEEYQSAP